MGPKARKLLLTKGDAPVTPNDDATTYTRIVVHADGPVTTEQSGVPFSDITAATREIIPDSEPWSELHSTKGHVGYAARDLQDGSLHLVVAADL